MTTPIGDSKGTNGGCLIGLVLAAISLLLVGAVVAAGVAFLRDAIRPEQHPQPTSSTSTRSTP